MVHHAQAYLATGRRAEALAEVERAERLGNRAEGLLAYAYAVLGLRDRAHAVVQELTRRGDREYVSPYLVALAYTGLGEKNLGLTWLERAANAREPALGPHPS